MSRARFSMEPFFGGYVKTGTKTITRRGSSWLGAEMDDAMRQIPTGCCDRLDGGLEDGGKRSVAWDSPSSKRIRNGNEAVIMIGT